MAVPILTDPHFARIWINATAPAVPPKPATPIGTPGEYAKVLCAINSKAFNQTLATGTAIIPDCADPLKVSVVKRTVISKDWSITGAGYLEMALLFELRAIMDNAVSINIVFEINDPTTAPTVATDGYWKGKAFLETFNVIANNTESYMTVDLNFTADGPATWTSTTTAPPIAPSEGP